MNSLLLLALLSCGGSSKGPPLPSSGTPALASGQTNVLLIFIDTLRADHVGAYGYSVPTTPYLDSIAARGVLFEEFYSNCSWTRPSMASMLTGLYPRSTGIHEEKYDKLSEELTTVAERFQSQGYVTVGVTANANLNTTFGFAQGFDHYSDSGAVWSWMKRKGGQRKYSSRENNLDDATSVTDRALAAADTLEAGPYFMQLLYVDPHEPYKATQAYQSKVQGSAKPGYDGDIRYVDDEIERLLNGMKARGKMENTLIVITSDHGEGLFDHPNVPDAATHGTAVYDSTLHVPLLVWHPSLPPRRVDDLSDGVDLVPTLLDLLGWNVPTDLAGQSLAPLINGTGRVTQPDVVFAETDWRANKKVTVRNKVWKYVRNDEATLWREQGAREAGSLRKPEWAHLKTVPPAELYKLGTPQDLPHNLVDRQGAEATRLAARIAEWEKQTPLRPPINRSGKDGILLEDGTIVPSYPKSDGQIDDKTREMLKMLGYLGDDDGSGDAAGHQH